MESPYNTFIFQGLKNRGKRNEYEQVMVVPHTESNDKAMKKLGFKSNPKWATEGVIMADKKSLKTVPKKQSTKKSFRTKKK